MQLLTMTAPDVVLHIGLHKTATRFLQRAVFAQLDPERFLVNPPALTHALKQALWFPSDETRRRAREAAATARSEAGDRTLLVSEPGISGDMYSSHEDWRENLELVHELFPDATIVYFVRRQSDWLQSAYRQSLVKGPGVPIEFFLNYREGDFQPRHARILGRARNLNALELRFADIYRGYVDRFGAEKVYLFRQEDLKKTPQPVYRRLAESLGIESLPEPPSRVSSNPAFSALAISIFFPGVIARLNGSGLSRRRGNWSPGSIAGSSESVLLLPGTSSTRSSIMTAIF
ncbi:MAG: hypothetical protein U5K73_06085 [Halofilum sp. (in: g-proteobacteria)]|nr:hypothetical protein [Halofilum sp. (in: g-proteobacteria)]